MQFLFQDFCAILDNISGYLNQLRDYVKDRIDSIRASKAFSIGLLFIVIILGLILISIWSSQIASIDSDPHIQKQNGLLKQNYVNDIYTNSSCNGDYEVQYQIAATREGCKCSEQIYIEQQNCIQINASNSTTINLFPFQQNDDLNFAQKICYVKSTTSMFEQIHQNNSCSNMDICGDKENNNHICVIKNGKCPISNFQIQKQAKINQKQKRISNIQTNHQEPLIGIIVTNGFCQTNSSQRKQNGSNYILNTINEDCQFEQYMTQIANYSVQQILRVNKIEEFYNITRKFDNLEYQKYVIYGLSYQVPPQCRINNQIFNQQDKILKYEKVLRNMAIVLLSCYLLNLFFIYAILQTINIPKWLYSVFNGFIIIFMLILFILTIIYKYRVEKECLNFQLPPIDYAYPILNIIVLIIQFIITILLHINIQVRQEQGPNQNNEVVANLENQGVTLQQIQQAPQYNQDVAPQEYYVNRQNQESDRANQQKQIEAQQIQIEAQQIQAPQNQEDKVILNHQDGQTINQEIIQQIQSRLSFQSINPRDTYNYEDLSPERQLKTKISKLNKKFKHARQSQSSKNLIYKKNTNNRQVYPDQDQEIDQLEI
ncbi:hypothetical protein pb186bvf_003439 [Paramecium bursaria]